MKIAISTKNDPYYNLSLEEILLKDESIKEDILLLYINDNTIVFGRNQNLHSEVNKEFVEENNIKLIRRISGGGAVYHDTGNLNFSFITNKEKHSYQRFLNPIIDFLKTLNLDAKFKGKNDLVIGDYKVSGNAQYIYKERMFHHGTLLFDSNLAVLGSALKPNKLKLESKGIKSARQRVSNIRSLLTEDLTADQFKEKMVEFFSDGKADIMDLEWYKNDEIKAHSNVRKSHDWTYGKNPKFQIKNEKRFDGGTISVELNVENNKILEIKFSGDFLSTNNFEDINQLFIQKDFNNESIKGLIKNIESFDEYFGKIKKDEIIELLLG